VSGASMTITSSLFYGVPLNCEVYTVLCIFFTAELSLVRTQIHTTEGHTRQRGR
jgi:hypothetical protein